MPKIKTDSIITLLPNTGRCVSIFKYKGRIKRILHEIKFNQNSMLAKDISTLITTFLKKNPDLKADYWIPIPLHRHKLKKRGFNQVDLLFQSAIATSGGLYAQIAYRKNKTIALFKLNPNERKKELDGAFSINTDISLENKRVIIVDDILTTGTTLEEMANTLKEEGVSHISALTLAQA